MKIGRITGATLVLSLATLLQGSTPEGTPLTISSHANIYGAGLPDKAPMPSPSGGGGGIPAVAVAIPPGGDQIVTFLKVTGTIDFGNASSPTGPDGGNFGYQVGAHRGISLFRAPIVGCLVGVFLSEKDPGPEAPEPLDFAVKGIDFPSLSPEIGQVFFIGDGVSKEGFVQQFRAPPTATRLFLGFADSYYSGAGPGYYGDNSGEVTATVRITSAKLDFPKGPGL